MPRAISVVGLVLALVAIAGCAPSAIKVTNAGSIPVSLIIYKDGSPEAVGSLAAGESKAFDLGDCSGAMTAVESSSGRVVATLASGCVDSWTIRE